MDPVLTAGFVAGIVQAIKSAGLPSRFSPLAAAVVGLLYGVGDSVQTHGLSAAYAGDYIRAGESGLVLGLAAVGVITTAALANSLRPAGTTPTQTQDAKPAA